MHKCEHAYSSHIPYGHGHPSISTHMCMCPMQVPVIGVLAQWWSVKFEVHRSHEPQSMRSHSAPMLGRREMVR